MRVELVWVRLIKIAVGFHVGEGRATLFDAASSHSASEGGGAELFIKEPFGLRNLTMIRNCVRFAA